MTIEKSSDSNNGHFDDGLLARSIPFTGKAPYETSSNAEEQRREVIELIREHADEINRAALRYDVPPETIAGAILWEAVENHKPKWLDLAGPGRIHPETAIFLYRDGKVPPGYTPLDLHKPIVAIEYIAAIMNESAENYQRIADVNIRKSIGILNTLYQGGDSQRRAEKLRDNRNRDIANKLSPRQPEVPSKEMGEYVEKYRRYIRTSLLGLTLAKNNSDIQPIVAYLELDKSLASKRAEAITNELEKSAISLNYIDFEVAFIEVLRNIKTLTVNEKQDIVNAQGINADRTLAKTNQEYQR